MPDDLLMTKPKARGPGHRPEVHSPYNVVVKYLKVPCGVSSRPLRAYEDWNFRHSKPVTCFGNLT